eukprot:gene52920-70758_t
MAGTVAGAGHACRRPLQQVCKRHAGGLHRSPAPGGYRLAMLTRLHHVALIASDYARSRDFYTRILGLAVVHEHYREARQSWKLDLALPDG